MKKQYILLYLLMFAIFSSCGKIGGDYIDQINRASETAINNINAAKDKAVSMAQDSISAIITKSIADANHGLAKTISDAQRDIQNKVEVSIDQKITSLNTSISSAQRQARIVGIFALFAMALAIGAICLVLYNKNCFRDNVVGVIQDSDRVKSLLEKTLQSSSAKGASKQDLDNAIKKFIQSSQFIEYLKKMGCIAVTEVSSKTTDTSKPVTTPNEASQSEPAPTTTTGPIELFAKDSRTKELSNVKSSFQPGESLYKLILSKKDATVAELTLLNEEPNVKRRILNNSEDFLTPICKVERKAENPKDVIIRNVGQASKISGDCWEVTKLIEVELS